MKHHITEKLPAHLTSLEGGDYHRFVMKGRKGIYYTVGEESRYSGFATSLLGREELAGGFSACVVLPGEHDWEGHEIMLADFDERTGRVLIGTDERYGEKNSEGEGVRIYLADLPP